MPSSHGSREEAIFAEAFEASKAERARILDQVGRDDPLLRSEVEKLLALHDTADEFMATPVLGKLSDQYQPQPGSTIDHFRLIAKSGEGGFGVVWRAEQLEPVRRIVALKILKLGMDTRSIIDRFDTERQALAMMNHPGISTVFDAGTTKSGRPYFVMEWVDGMPIHRYCQVHQLTLVQRLKLFIGICRAVQHAHQKGILHLDLKPTNILVTQQDGQPLPKIIDFGIAKAMHLSMQDQPGSDASQKTSEPSQSVNAYQLLGTPEFMSPEQVDTNAQVDTRSDVYSLGAVLYQLLAGTPPLDLFAHDKPLDAESIRDWILHDVPEPASERLLKQAGPEFDYNGFSAVEATKIQGDLDWILAKALSKEPSRRYGSASELSRDVERHLAHEPVSAAPQTGWYLANKFVRRHRYLVAASLLIFVTTVVGMIATTTGLIHAERQRKKADRQWQRADQQREEADRQRSIAVQQANEARLVADLLQRWVQDANPTHGFPIDYTVRQQLDDFWNSLTDELIDHPEVEAELRQTIGRAYVNLRALEKAGPNLRRALELKTRLFDESSRQVTESRVEYARFLVLDSQLQAAEREIALVMSHTDESQPTAHLVGALSVIGRIRFAQGRFSEAEKHDRLAWEISRALVGDDHLPTVELQSLAGFSAMMIRDVERAEKLIRGAVDQIAANWPEKKFELNRAKYHLLRLLIRRNQLDEATTIVEQVIADDMELFGRDSHYVVTDLIAKVMILRDEGRWDEAEAVAREAASIADRVTVDRSLVQAQAYRRVAELVELQNRPSEAEQWWSKTIEARRSMVGDNFRVAFELGLRGFLLRELGRWEEAITCYERAIEVLQDDAERPQLYANWLYNLADLHHEMGQLASAQSLLARALAVFETGSPRVPLVHADYLRSLIDDNQLERAEQQVDDWEIQAIEDDDAMLSVIAHVGRGQLAMAVGDHDLARGWFVEAIQRLGPLLDELREFRFLVRIGDLRAQCDIELEEFARAERTLLNHADMTRNGSVSIDRRRARKLLITLYEVWNRPADSAHWSSRVYRK